MVVNCDECGEELKARVENKAIHVEPCKVCQANAVEDAEVSLNTLDVWCSGCGDDLTKEEHSDGKGLTVGLCERCKALWVHEGELRALEVLG